MTPHRPQKTAADYMVIAISPALIMALVGSICFFLIEVFYQGLMAGIVRWVMFWFVVGIVLVSRIAIEKSPEYAAFYGLALAGAAWLWLVRMQPAWLLGTLLLGVVWFCAHKLVWDSTLIDEDEDSSGQGLLQKREPAKTDPKAKGKRKRAASGSPGMWVVYFSLAALPLFGIGQSVLPANAAGSRRLGLFFVVLYMSAALGLLVTTSFLGLRRYLRQRYLKMPAAVAFSWLKLGAGVAVIVLVAALPLPRPGANQAWTALRHQIDLRLQQASRYAAKGNAPGQSQGRPGNQSGGDQGTANTSGRQQGGNPAGSSASSLSPPAAAVPASPAGSAYQFLRTVFMITAAVIVGWWLFRCRFLLLEIARTLLAALVDAWRSFLAIGSVRRTARAREAFEPRTRPAVEFRNPFYADQGHSRPPAEIIFYTYDAVRAWAARQGVEAHPEQTAREFCQAMAEFSPDLTGPYRHLSFLYAHAAYGLRLPAPCDLEPLKELWRLMTWEQQVKPSEKAFHK